MKITQRWIGWVLEYSTSIIKNRKCKKVHVHTFCINLVQLWKWKVLKLFNLRLIPRASRPRKSRINLHCRFIHCNSKLTCMRSNLTVHTNKDLPNTEWCTVIPIHLCNQYMYMYFHVVQWKLLFAGTCRHKVFLWWVDTETSCQEPKLGTRCYVPTPCIKC